jgi:hypothetical protein
MTEHRRLNVIPRPPEGTRSVLTKSEDDRDSLIVQGEAGFDLSYECGVCGAPLAHGVRPGQLQNLVLQCNKCGAFNETLE